MVGDLVEMWLLFLAFEENMVTEKVTMIPSAPSLRSRRK
jgi:hypothetical protein